jgi:NTP pyrophosphatase (non-canonical NTP hydrolase)
MNNKPTEGQRERLEKVLEEAAEVQQAICKILMHGYQVDCEGIRYNNKEDLEKEFGDFFAAFELLANSGDINDVDVCNHAKKKSKVITKYMSHQGLGKFENCKYKHGQHVYRKMNNPQSATIWEIVDVQPKHGGENYYVCSAPGYGECMIYESDIVVTERPVSRFPS